jgi:hypothetical protein
MTDQLQMFSPETSGGSPNATSSPASGDGPLPSSLLVCLPSDLSGLDPVPVSLSVRREGGKVVTMNGISGPTSFASSTPAGPLASWENRLRARLGTIGSTESPLIWEARATPAGRSISRLRPWTPRRSGKGSTGSPWPAPLAMEHAKGGPRLSDDPKQGHDLATKMFLAPWPAPDASTGGPRPPDPKRGEAPGLAMVMTAAPWPAVQASAAAAGHTSRSGDRKDELLLQGMMRENSPVSPWATPRASDHKKTPKDGRGPNSHEGDPLPVQMAPWRAPQAGDERAALDSSSLDQEMLAHQMDKARPCAAPRAGDWRSGSSQVGTSSLRPGGSMLPEQMTETQDRTAEQAGGPAPSGSSATTARRGGSPTPVHPCWLQGFPAVWLLGAASATRSASPKPSKSSRP